MSTIDYTQLKADLIEEFGMAALAPEKQDELLGKMIESLLKRIFMNTMERLGETGVGEYEELIKGNPEEKAVAAFLESHIPGYDAFVNEIVEQFKKDMKLVALG